MKGMRTKGREGHNKGRQAQEDQKIRDDPDREKDGWLRWIKLERCMYQ
jgi:hypothetical protein